MLEYVKEDWDVGEVPVQSLFRHFRQWYSPEASYHMVYVRYGKDWISRFVSMLWLIGNKLPVLGYTMDSSGYPFVRERQLRTGSEKASK